MDGKTCVTTPTTTTTTTAIPLRAGQVIKLRLADSSSPNAWFSFTATNDEAVQRWYHFMWFGYSYASAVPLKLYDARPLLHGVYGSYADTWAPLTFAMQNVYGHGYAAYWFGAAAADGRVRTSYTLDSDKMPVTFVKVGCNRYKLRNMYKGNHDGLYLQEVGHSWVKVTADFNDATVVSVWHEGEAVDECGNRIPTSATVLESRPEGLWAAAAACGFFGGAAVGLLALGVWRRRIAPPELREQLIAA